MDHQVHLKSSLPHLDLQGKRVFLRADLNVPLANKRIVNDHRLQALVPTIELIQRKGGTIILATHIGRPKNKEAALSTQILMPWFAEHGYSITFQDDLHVAEQESRTLGKNILLLENMRFFPGEKTNDAEFAQQLARLGDIYVCDAFGALHRADTSITLTPELFPKDKRTIGLLVEHELEMLNKLLAAPKQSFVLVLGGGKVADKLPLLNSFLDKVSTVLLCPAIVFTFARALGKPVGKSLVDEQSMAAAKQFLAAAQAKGVKLCMPVDYLATSNNFDGPLLPTPVNQDQFPQDAVGVSIGPKTAELFAQELRSAKTIFFNGLMGSASRPETLVYVKTLFAAMAESQAFSVVGGGDSVAAAELLGFADKLSYLSTGGGATLTYLSGRPLPGLRAFLP